MNQTNQENQTKLGCLPFGAKFTVPGSDQVYEVVSQPRTKSLQLYGTQSCRIVGEAGFKTKSFRNKTLVTPCMELSEHSEKS